MLIFISSSFLLQFLFFHNFTKKIQIANFFLRTLFLKFFSIGFLYFYNEALLFRWLRLMGLRPSGLTHSFASQKILENSAFYMLLI